MYRRSDLLYKFRKKGVKESGEFGFDLEGSVVLAKDSVVDNVCLIPLFHALLEKFSGKIGVFLEEFIHKN